MEQSKSINVVGFVVGVFSVVFLSKISSYLAPYNLYFTFSALLFGYGGSVGVGAVALKLAIPTLVGFIMYYFPYKFTFQASKVSVAKQNIIFYLDNQADLTAMTVGFFSAFLLAWPFIVYWDILMEPDMLQKKSIFLLIYFLYFLAYMYFAKLGVCFARVIAKFKRSKNIIFSEEYQAILIEAIRSSIKGVVTSAIATYLSTIVGLSS